MVQARGHLEAARGAKSHKSRRDSSPEREIQASGGCLQRGVEAAARRCDDHHEPTQIGGHSRVTSSRDRGEHPTEKQVCVRYDPRKDPLPTRRIS